VNERQQPDAGWRELQRLVLEVDIRTWLNTDMRRLWLQVMHDTLYHTLIVISYDILFFRLVEYCSILVTKSYRCEPSIRR